MIYTQFAINKKSCWRFEMCSNAKWFRDSNGSNSDQYANFSTSFRFITINKKKSQQYCTLKLNFTYQQQQQKKMLFFVHFKCIIRYLHTNSRGATGNNFFYQLIKTEKKEEGETNMMNTKAKLKRAQKKIKTKF